MWRIHSFLEKQEITILGKVVLIFYYNIFFDSIEIVQKLILYKIYNTADKNWFYTKAINPVRTFKTSVGWTHHCSISKSRRVRKLEKKIRLAITSGSQKSVTFHVLNSSRQRKWLCGRSPLLRRRQHIGCTIYFLMGKKNKHIVTLIGF